MEDPQAHDLESRVAALERQSAFDSDGFRKQLVDALNQHYVQRVDQAVIKQVRGAVQEHLSQLDPERLAEREVAILDASEKVKGATRKAIEEILDTIKARGDDVLKELDERVEVLENELSVRRERVTAAIEDLTSEAQQAARGKLVDAYARDAGKARGRALAWTVLMLVVASLAVSYAAFAGDPGSFSTGEAITHIGIVTSLVAVAGFLGRLAADERRDVRNWTHMQLQLSTSGAFVENMQPEQRAQAELMLALQFFPGQTSDPHGDAPAPGSPTSLELLRTLLLTPSAAPGARAMPAKNEPTE